VPNPAHQLKKEEDEGQQKQQRQEQNAEREAEEGTQCKLEEAEERRQHDHEEVEPAEAAHGMEPERLAWEQKRKTLVRAFLKEHGYNDDVNAPKRTKLKTKYPIHTAAKIGNPQIVAALLEEGANPVQKDSSGKTAAWIAQSKNKKGTHANVLVMLGGA